MNVSHKDSDPDCAIQVVFHDEPAVLSDSFAALQDGAHTTSDFPTILRVVMVVRIRWVPHKKHDIVDEMEVLPIQDVLEMSSGIEFNEDYANPDASINVLGQRIFLGQTTDDWIAQRKRARAPGTEHYYSSIDTQVLGMVLKAATGKSVAQYMQEKLWSPMGAEGDARWVTDAHGVVLAFAGLNARLRDYARFGQLYIDGGRNLRGEQVLPQEWVGMSVKPRTPYLQPGREMEHGNPRLGYAYQWWVPKGGEGEFTAIGVYGQFIYVNPMRRVVIAKNSAYVDYNKDGTQMEYQSIEAFRAIARSLRP